MRNFFLIFFLPLQSLAQLNRPVPTGRLVDIGGYRLHIDAKGKGSPAVVLIAGSQAFSFDWALVAPEIAKITLACTYDRPALAWSDPGPWMRFWAFRFMRRWHRGGLLSLVRQWRSTAS